MKKIYFLLTVLILLYSCEKDGSLEETTAVKISQLEGKILTKQELLESNKKMAKVLERYEKPLSTHAANRTIDSNHYKILYDEIKYLENGDYHSYTFGIENNGPTGIVQNLLLSYQSDGTYKAFIVTYKLTQHEQDAILEGKKVNLEGKFSIDIIDSDINLILNKSQDVLYDKCPPGKCCEAYTSQGTGWELLKIVSCIPSGGGSGDSGGTGTLDWPEYQDPGTDAGIDDNGSGETTGGGGGTSTGGDTSNDDPSCIADSNGDCIGDTTTPLIPKPTAATKLITYLGIDTKSQEAYWLNNVASEAEIMELHKFLSNNGFTQNAKDFALEATRVAMKYPDFDMDIARSFDSPYNIDLSEIKPDPANPEPDKVKFMYLYDKLLETSFFENVIADVFGAATTEMNVKFEITEDLTVEGSEDPNGSAKYIIKTGKNALVDNLVTIQINKEYLETQPLIRIAKTLVHEVVHTHLALVKISSPYASEVGGYSPEEFAALLDAHLELKADEHEFIAQHYIPTISKAVEEILPLIETPDKIKQIGTAILFYGAENLGPWNWNEFFMYISWSGLSETDYYKDKILDGSLEQKLYDLYDYHSSVYENSANFFSLKAL